MLAMGSGLFHLAVVASSGNGGVTELELDPKAALRMHSADREVSEVPESR